MGDPVSGNSSELARIYMAYGEKGERRKWLKALLDRIRKFFWLGLTWMRNVLGEKTLAFLLGGRQQINGFVLARASRRESGR